MNSIPRYHALLDFLLCRKKYYWAWHEQLEPIVESPALTAGRAVHDAIARSLQSKRYEDLKEPEKLQKVELLRVSAKAASERVIEEYGERVVAIEEPVVLRFGEVELRGRPDLVVKSTKSEAYRVVDYKTYSTGFDSMYQQNMLNSQLHFYCLAVEQKTQRKVEGYDVVAIQKVRSLTSIPTVSILSFDLTNEQKESFSAELKQMLVDLEQVYLDNGPWYKNTGACGAHFGTCPYIDLCCFGEAARASFKKRELDEEVS